MSQFRNPAEPHRRLLAESFYAAHCPKSAGEISYIDFFYPVRIIAIPKGTRLWGFKDPRVSPLHRFNTFFTIPGTDVCILGVHDSGTLSFKDHKTQQVLQLNPKVTRKSLNEYEVMTDIPAVLESVCKDGIDTWSIQGESKPVAGGGWQYKIPEAFRYLRVVSTNAG
jgi:hypothetical protein